MKDTHAQTEKMATREPAHKTVVELRKHPVLDPVFYPPNENNPGQEEMHDHSQKTQSIQKNKEGFIRRMMQSFGYGKRSDQNSKQGSHSDKPTI